MGIFDFFKKRTSRRTAEEQLEAAFSYANERDFEKALTLMTRASERGLAEAQARLGVILVTGSDVEKDLPQAIEWFRRAAIQGHPLALWNLALQYSIGDALQRDPVLAYKLAYQASMWGHSLPKGGLLLLKEDLTDEERADATQSIPYWDLTFFIGPPVEGHLGRRELFADFQESWDHVDGEEDEAEPDRPFEHEWASSERETISGWFSEDEVDPLFTAIFGEDVTLGAPYISFSSPQGQWVTTASFSFRDIITSDGFPVATPPRSEAMKAITGSMALLLAREGVGYAVTKHEPDYDEWIEIQERDSSSNIYEDYYESGQLRQQVSLKNGIWEGTALWYYESGQLKQKTTFKDGEPTGPYETYYESGKLKGNGSQKNEVPEGRHEEYYENGEFKGFASYKDGILHGPQEGYDENGQLRNTETYKDGILHGPQEGYYENGQLMRRGIFKDGEKCGEWIEDGETVTYDPC